MAATAALALSALQALAAPETTPPPPVAALPTLNIPAYMGTWYQVAWFPNRFQKQCVSDTAATYRRLPAGECVEAINGVRLAVASVRLVEAHTSEGRLQLRVRLVPRLWLLQRAVPGSCWPRPR